VYPDNRVLRVDWRQEARELNCSFQHQVPAGRSGFLVRIINRCEDNTLFQDANQNLRQALAVRRRAPGGEYASAAGGVLLEVQRICALKKIGILNYILLLAPQAEKLLA